MISHIRLFEKRVITYWWKQILHKVLQKITSNTHIQQRIWEIYIPKTPSVIKHILKYGNGVTIYKKCCSKGIKYIHSSLCFECTCIHTIWALTERYSSVRAQMLKIPAADEIFIHYTPSLGAVNETWREHIFACGVLQIPHIMLT